MDSGLLIVSLVLFLIGIGLIISAYKSYKKSKFFNAADLQSIDNINEGPVKVKGKSLPTKHYRVPFQRNPVFTIVIEQYRLNLNRQQVDHPHQKLHSR